MSDGKFLKWDDELIKEIIDGFEEDISPSVLASCVIAIYIRTVGNVAAKNSLRPDHATCARIGKECVQAISQVMEAWANSLPDTVFMDEAATAKAYMLLQNDMLGHILYKISQNN